MLFNTILMEVWRKMVSYLTLRKQESPTGEEKSFNLKAMHTINKISLLMFLVGMIVLLVRWLG